METRDFMKNVCITGYWSNFYHVVDLLSLYTYIYLNFSIPVIDAVMEKKDLEYFSKGFFFRLFLVNPFLRFLIKFYAT